MPIPFPPNGGHLLGQPFTLSNVSMPVSATLRCNCAHPPADLHVVNSAPVTCPVCARTYLVAFNPTNGQLMVATAAENQQVPS